MNSEAVNWLGNQEEKSSDMVCLIPDDLQSDIVLGTIENREAYPSVGPCFGNVCINARKC